MIYHSYIPSGPLGDFIERFWLCSDQPCHSRERILPSGTIELVINLHDDEVRVFDSMCPQQFQRFPGVVVSGTYHGAFVIDPSQHASMMGVHFRPGGAFPFLGTPVREISNSHVALELLWGSPAIDLRDRLCSARTHQERFLILEAALQARLYRFQQHHPAVLLALDIFREPGRGGSIEAITKRVGLSQRRFIQLFTAQVGLSPKFFSRVLRFQHAKESVDRLATPDWSRLALECGYYDQSHLIHDFREFSGLNPSAYLCARGDQLLQNHIPVIG